MAAAFDCNSAWRAYFEYSGSDCQIEFYTLDPFHARGDFQELALRFSVWDGPGQSEVSKDEDTSILDLHSTGSATVLNSMTDFYFSVINVSGTSDVF